MPTDPQPLRGYPIYEDGSYGPRFLGTYEPFASNDDYPHVEGANYPQATNMYGYEGRTPITPTPEYRHGVPGDGPQRAWFRHGWDSVSNSHTTTMYLTAEDYAHSSNGISLAHVEDDIVCAGGPWNRTQVFVPVFGNTGPVAHEAFWTDFVDTYEEI